MLADLLSWLLRLLLWLPCFCLRSIQLRLSRSRRSVLLTISPDSAGTYGLGGPGLRQLASLAEDRALRVVAIRIHALPGGWASAQALRDAIRRLRSAGKKVLVHLHVPMPRGIYVASAADEVWMLPGSELFWTGLGMRPLFYGALLERLGVQADLEAAGDYKSFGESYSRPFPSAENREQLQVLLSDLQEQMLKEWSNRRKRYPLKFQRELKKECN